MDKQELLDIIQKSENKFKGLKVIEYDGLEENIHELEDAVRELKSSGNELLSQNDTLQIGIVGQVKAGKSSFLNSLFFNGENILPKAATPMTAGLTVIEYAEKNTFEVEYFSNADWDVFVRQNDDYCKIVERIRKEEEFVGVPESIIKMAIKNRTSETIRSAHEMIEACSSRAKAKIGADNYVQHFDDINELKNILEQYVGAKGEYTSVVKSLYIKMKDDRLKGLRIVDTPGVNDPVVSRENRTRTFLNSCHGVFMLSQSHHFLEGNDISFLNSRIGGAGIGTVVLLASKFDSVLQDNGAGRENSGLGNGNLSDAIDEEKKKRRKRLRELSETIDEKVRNKISFDTTAGIGFSIAHKTSEKWDKEEINAVSQMKRFYPDDFSTDEDIQKNFESLANIPEIREKYLDGLFMKNKDAIISQKVTDFFDLNKKDIFETVKRMLERYENVREELNTKTIEEIKNQRKLQGRLFDNLKNEFSNVFRSFENDLQSNVKHICNTVPFDETKRIPTEKTSGSISYKGGPFGFSHNKEMSYDQVNTFELSSQIEKSIDDYCNGWNSAWIEMFDKARETLLDKLNNKICEFEKEIMNSSFDDRYYRNLIDGALDDLRQNKELSIGDLKNNFIRQGYDIANKQFYPTGTGDLHKDEIPLHLSKSLVTHNGTLLEQIRELSNYIRYEMSKEVQKQLGGAICVINGMKSSFAEKLKKEGDEYLEMLERQMADKKASLEKLKSIIKHLTELSKLYA